MIFENIGIQGIHLCIASLTELYYEKHSKENVQELFWGIVTSLGHNFDVSPIRLCLSQIKFVTSKLYIDLKLF